MGAALLALLPLGPARACALSLVLALDVSSSVDSREDRLQRDGLAAALTDPQVTEAIRAQGGIWLAAFEWSGAWNQYDWLDWTFLLTPAEIRAAAARIAASERQVDEFPTALGFAIGHALARQREAPATCRRRVIDIAGDGVNNHGFSPALAYHNGRADGITVNGLVIQGDTPPPVPYFRRYVLHGPGAFLEIAESYEDYARAMRRKLLREISGPAYVLKR